jgi:predicted DNA-binding helix-hairpin-helix protein
MEATLKSELLEKAKLTLSLDEVDTSHDSYLELLIDAEFEIALARTGRTEAEINEALKEAIVRNVGIRFDSMEDKRDLDTYHNFNKQPMF